MSADFYCDFDRQCFCDDVNLARTADYRSVFHQDRDRIMFTPAFRRLQAKTQVFQAGEYDFYRTRLTHSLEVANLAKSIAVWLRQSGDAIAIDPDLLEAVCFAHDIGHPPFGHAGESVLNELMGAYGGFEGNAQTLRILTRTIYSRAKGRGGMSPTRALLDGVLKYKRLHRDRGADTNHFIYDDQAEILAFCFDTADLAAALGADTKVNDFHSIECQVMDLADDIAYSCFDVVDGWKARFLAADRLAAWRDAQEPALDRLQAKQLDDLLDMMAHDKVQPKMNVLIGQLIKDVSLRPLKNFMTGRTRRHAYEVVIRPEAKSRIRLHKKICRDLIFRTSTIQQIEFKGTHILRELGRTLFSNYLSMSEHPAVLIPREVHLSVIAAESQPARARLLCDHLSGMTDAYALRSYKRLLDPDYGSISELI